MLLSGTVQSPPQMYRWVSEFCKWTILGTETQLMQFNPPGLPLHTFEAPAIHEGGDGVSAALQTQAAGIASRRVTLLSAKFIDFPDKVSFQSIEETGEMYKTALQKLLHRCGQAGAVEIDCSRQGCLLGTELFFPAKDGLCGWPSGGWYSTAVRGKPMTV